MFQDRFAVTGQLMSGNYFNYVVYADSPRDAGEQALVRFGHANVLELAAFPTTRKK